MKRLTTVAASLALVSLIPVSSPAERDKQQESTTEAIQKVVTAYTKAFNEADAEALADLWTPQGDYLGPRGQRIQGRDAIRENFRRFFSANSQTNLTATITAVRLVGQDVAVVDGIAEVAPPLQGPPVDGHFVVVLHKQDNRWFVESARDILVSKPSNYEHIKQLQWLIGDWTDSPATREGVSVQSACDWTVNKNFIIRKFTAEIDGHVSTAGTQLIGWDPSTSTIRSWVFDSDGGFAKGNWKRRGDRWIIKASGVLQDGSKVSSTNMLTRIDDDTFTFQSRNRTINGRPEPDIEEITIQRVSSQAAGQDLPGPAQESPRETILPE